MRTMMIAFCLFAGCVTEPETDTHDEGRGTLTPSPTIDEQDDGRPDRGDITQTEEDGSDTFPCTQLSDCPEGLVCSVDNVCIKAPL